jgi:hypothetical protein
MGCENTTTLGCEARVTNKQTLCTLVYLSSTYITGMALLKVEGSRLFSGVGLRAILCKIKK